MLEQHRWDSWAAHLQSWKTHPMEEALNTHEGGYVLAIALSFLLPVVRVIMRNLLWEVSILASSLKGLYMLPPR